MSDEITPNNSDTTVETLPGDSDMGEANDAVHFRNNLFASLSLPKKHSDLTRVSFPARTSRPDGTAASAKPKEWRNAKGLLHRDDGPAITSADGSQEWWRNEVLEVLTSFRHSFVPSDKDLPPTHVLSDGTKEWRNGSRQLHRDDGPAIIRADGSQYWFRDGKLHRDDGPALLSDISQQWYRDGKLHRDDGPALLSDISQQWYRDGKLHRDDGPAITWANGSQFWYRDGKCHRDDGPAVTYSDGFQYWYRDGERQPDPSPPSAKDQPPTNVRPDGSKEWRNAKGQSPPRACYNSPAITEIVYE